MMLAGSLAVAIPEASAWRSRCGCASTPTLPAKVRNAWGGVLGPYSRVAFGAQDEVKLDRPWGLAGLDQRQPNRRSMPTQRPDDLFVLVLVLAERGGSIRSSARTSITTPVPSARRTK
jgi:hypothetical protein